MAISSILHRISGVVIAILLPEILCLLNSSVKSEKDFYALKHSLAGFGLKFVIWVFLCALTYHFIAGVRHLVMDLGFGESLQASKRSAAMVLILSLITFILYGGWLW
jgi:succinate dehydrogenase / fumarate reductase cytochrome b subunit